MKQQTLCFTEKNATFRIEDPQYTTGLYFPLVNEAGMKSSVTPDLKGDAKLDQNSFLLTPVSAEDLHNSRSGRNIWVYQAGAPPWSTTGQSAWQIAERFSEDESDQVTLEAGILWMRISRTNRKIGLSAEIMIFVPDGGEANELIEVRISNISSVARTITVTAAIPLFGRSADNIRDHRHVTSLLNRIALHRFGLVAHPTLTFDERGHRSNTLSYSVWGSDDEEHPPLGFFPDTPSFIGEGGSFEWPEAVVRNMAPRKAESEERTVEGFETAGALRFKTVRLEPKQTVSYRLILAISVQADKAPEYLKKEAFGTAFTKTLNGWDQYSSRLYFTTGDHRFDQWLQWVAVQPELRRLFGCSFLPHHDYGRGGRGWRDLWQDCLALLLVKPNEVRQLLLNNYAGVRIDGSNANIIGTKSGEFLADRNAIPRAWMDHGTWPFLTTQLYIHQSGDLSFLLEKQSYFKDQYESRCKDVDQEWSPSQGTQLKTAGGELYEGTILEHLLVLHLTAVCHLGAHGNILLEGADWNDGMDMAGEKGESVAFSALYAGNLIEMAVLVRALETRQGIRELSLLREIPTLLGQSAKLTQERRIKERGKLLQKYFKAIHHTVSGQTISIPTEQLASLLEAAGSELLEHIRTREWIGSREGYSWFNGYYDNEGRRLEGDSEDGVRMTLTGQVFTMLCGAADDDQAREVIRGVDRFLWDERIGGPRLNTNFHRVLLDMGRCFGFAYGHKENGSMFSHMAVMYAYALYRRGFVKQGHRILTGIFTQAMNFNVSRIFPGIPEYFDQNGRGMYPYLTGSASWFLLTFLTQAMGIRGEYGDLLLAPKLLGEQFDSGGRITTHTRFAQTDLEIRYLNKEKTDYPGYTVASVSIDDIPTAVENRADGVLIPLPVLQRLTTEQRHRIEVSLLPK